MQARVSIGKLVLDSFYMVNLGMKTPFYTIYMNIIRSDSSSIIHFCDTALVSHIIILSLLSSTIQISSFIFIQLISSPWLSISIYLSSAYLSINLIVYLSNLSHLYLFHIFFFFYIAPMDDSTLFFFCNLEINICYFNPFRG